MANVNKNVLANKQPATGGVQPTSLALMVNSEQVKERFEKMLGKKSAGFLSSLLTMTNQSVALKKCTPQSVLSAASIAASLDLPINPNLGFAWVVGYGNTASFQIGYKGLIQLAQRSGLMKSIIVTEVYEGEILNFNRFTETYEVGKRLSDAVVGYYASFELTNGFKKCSYWTRDEVLAHAKRFSKAYNSGPWKTDEVAMSKKTVLSALLRTFAPLSTEMQMGLTAEDKDTKENETTGETEYTDVEAETIAEAEVIETEDGRKVNTETGELFGE